MIYNVGGCPLRRHANVDSLLPVAVPTVTPGWRTLTRACGGQEVRQVGLRTNATATTATGSWIIYRWAWQFTGSEGLDEA